MSLKFSWNTSDAGRFPPPNDPSTCSLESAKRAVEIAKTECGKKHFEALAVDENPAQYKTETTVGELLAKIL